MSDLVIVQETKHVVDVVTVGIPGPPGPQGPSGAGSTGTTYIFNQDIPDSTWTINHNLGQYPSVTIVDSAGNVNIGGITYINANTLIVTFNGVFSGKVYLN
jgi:hypothetical protein